MTDIFEKTKSKLNIDSYSTMQMEAFQTIASGDDTMLLSKTGSGKTLAFLLPLFKEINTNSKKSQMLILAPTRELALQIQQVGMSLGLGYQIACCYGGHPIRYEKAALSNLPEVIIGTPGRILDHLERMHFDPLTIRFFVLDEFDKILEMGFHKQLEMIIRFLRYKPQYVLTSATNMKYLPEFLPVKEVKHVNHLNEELIGNMLLYKVPVPNNDKYLIATKLILEIGNTSTFIFLNYRKSVEDLYMHFREQKIECDFLHGGLDQIERENVISKVRNGTTKILITTDLAGRGLDIPHIHNVVHFHLPINEETFLHRNGRTARMHASGKVFVLISDKDKEEDYLERITESYHLGKVKNVLKLSPWNTLIINKGRRDKIRKVDVLGFLLSDSVLNKDDVGLIEVKERYTLVAIKRNKIKAVIRRLNKEKIKRKSAILKVL